MSGRVDFSAWWRGYVYAIPIMAAMTHFGVWGQTYAQWIGNHAGNAVLLLMIQLLSDKRSA